MDNLSVEELMKNIKLYEVKSHYSGWGWFLFTVIGMSAMPSKVEFIDKSTGNIAGTSTDPEILKKFVGR